MGTLAEYMFFQFSLNQYIEFALRILVAVLCGAAIGFERSKRLKEAGFRTHIIVCVASTLMMIVSKYGFVDMTDASGILYNGTRTTDPARLAAQVITGVGFLGAGIIFRNGSTIKGLTTAAGIWATSGIGLALGAGMYPIGIGVTLILCLLQYITHKFVFGADALVTYKLSFTVKNSEELHQILLDKAKSEKMDVSDSRISYHDGYVTYDVTLRSRKALTGESVRKYLISQGELKELGFTVIG